MKLKPTDLFDLVHGRAFRERFCEMNVSDDIFLGPQSIFTRGLSTVLGGQGFGTSQGPNPTQQIGAGPMARVFTFAITPLTKSNVNLAAAQALVAGAPLVLAAGAGVTAAAAVDGSGRTMYLFDVPRLVSLTAQGGANLSGINFVMTGFDLLGRITTSQIAGPNANTVTFPKAVLGVLSIVPNLASANQVSAGSADTFGIPFLVPDASYVISVKGNNTLATDAGTLVAGDATTPATVLTGDPRGTYAPTFASNGARKLTMAIHLDGSQCGPQATFNGLMGVPPV